MFLLHSARSARLFDPQNPTDAAFRHHITGVVPGLASGDDPRHARALAEALARCNEDLLSSLVFGIAGIAPTPTALRALAHAALEHAYTLEDVHAAFREAKLRPTLRDYKALVRRWLREPPMDLGDFLRAARRARVPITDALLITAAKNAIIAGKDVYAVDIQRRIGKRKVPRTLWAEAAKRSLRRGDVGRAMWQLWVGEYDATPDRIVSLPANRRTGAPAERGYRWQEFGITIRRSDLLRIPFREESGYVSRGPLPTHMRLDSVAIGAFLSLIVALDEDASPATT